jgi:hypothetical protein
MRNVCLAEDMGLKERQMRNVIRKAELYGLIVRKEWTGKDKCISHYSWPEVRTKMSKPGDEVRQKIAEPGNASETLRQ